MANFLLNRLAISSHIQGNIQKYAKGRIICTRLMSKKQNQKGKTDGNCPMDNKCGDSQFFGGCFKKEPEYKCPKKKVKTKRCRDQCKNDPCKNGRH